MIFFSNRLGCLGSVVVSIVLTVIVLVVCTSSNNDVAAPIIHGRKMPSKWQQKARGCQCHAAGLASYRPPAWLRRALLLRVLVVSTDSRQWPVSTLAGTGH